MNCTICNEDVNDHVEGRSCDRCVAEKLGWNFQEESPEGMFCPFPHGEMYERVWYKSPDDSLWCCSIHSDFIPHYSSPTMSAETWGLVERMREKGFKLTAYEDCWNLQTQYLWIPEHSFRVQAPTPTLAIIRAFLGCEEVKDV